MCIRDSCIELPSVAGLRMQLNCNSHSKLKVNILKQPQMWGGQECTISLSPHYENWQRLSVSLLPVHSHYPRHLPTEQHARIHQENALLVNEVQNITKPKVWHSTVKVIAPLSALKTAH